MRNKLCKEKEQQVSDADFTSVSVGIFLVSEQMTTEWLCWRNTVRTTTDAKDSSHCTLGFAEHGQSYCWDGAGDLGDSKRPLNLLLWQQECPVFWAILFFNK